MKATLFHFLQDALTNSADTEPTVPDHETNRYYYLTTTHIPPELPPLPPPPKFHVESERATVIEIGSSGHLTPLRN